MKTDSRGLTSAKKPNLSTQITQSPIHEVPRRHRNKNSEESHPYLTVPISYKDYFDKTDSEMKRRWNTEAGEQSGTCTTQGQAHPHIV